MNIHMYIYIYIYIHIYKYTYICIMYIYIVEDVGGCKWQTNQAKRAASKAT